MRGLDYYVKTVFEFISDDIGAQSTICGGGRYDGLVEELSGPKLCGIGFGMGLTRIILALRAKAAKGELELAAVKKPFVYIASMGEKAALYAFDLCEKLRADGIYAECDVVSRSMKAQMKYADKKGAAFVLALGDNELETGKATLKNMTNKERSVEIDLPDAEKTILDLGK